MSGLIYTGGGYRGFLRGVPARNLDADEVKQHGGQQRLLESGIYKKPSGKKPKTAAEPEGGNS